MIDALPLTPVSLRSLGPLPQGERGRSLRDPFSKILPNLKILIIFYLTFALNHCLYIWGVRMSELSFSTDPIGNSERATAMPTVKSLRNINAPKTTYQAQNVTPPECVTFCHILTHPAYERQFSRPSECDTSNSVRSHICARHSAPTALPFDNRRFHGTVLAIPPFLKGAQSNANGR